MHNLNIKDELEIKASLNRTFNACEILEMPLPQNFKKIYRFNDLYLKID